MLISGDLVHGAAHLLDALHVFDHAASIDIFLVALVVENAWWDTHEDK